MLAVSVASSTAQILDLSGGSVVQSLPLENLIGNYPPGDVGLTNGTLSTWVVSGIANDTSGYTFIYQLQNNGPDMITSVEFSGFNGSEVLGTGTFTNVFGLSLLGSYAASPDGNFSFNTVTSGGAASFDNADLSNLSAENNGYFLVVYTDVGSIALNNGETMDDFSSSAPIYAPSSTSVPEQSSGLALLGGLASLYLFVRRRHAAM